MGFRELAWFERLNALSLKEHSEHSETHISSSDDGVQRCRIFSIFRPILPDTYMVRVLEVKLSPNVTTSQ